MLKFSVIFNNNCIFLYINKYENLWTSDDLILFCKLLFLLLIDSLYLWNNLNCKYACYWKILNMQNWGAVIGWRISKKPYSKPQKVLKVLAQYFTIIPRSVISRQREVSHKHGLQWSGSLELYILFYLHCFCKKFSKCNFQISSLHKLSFDFHFVILELWTAQKCPEKSYFQFILHPVTLLKPN